jgi:D-threo-aldose 1-dehydrogenase
VRSTILGSSGVPVTAIGLGAAPLGNLYTPVDDDVAAATVSRAWECGIRYVDTAPHYGLGLSERRVGAAVRALPGPISLSTKVSRILVPLPEDEAPGSDLANGFAVRAHRKRIWDFSADGIRRSLLDSLDRLGLDRIDVALLHDPDDHEREAVATALPALLRLREEGLIGAVGAGMNQSAMLARFVAAFDLDVVLIAGRYSLVDQTALADLLPVALARGTSVVVGGVFGSGLLAVDQPEDDATYLYETAPPDLLARVRSIASVCREHGTTLPTAALHFVFGHHAVACALLGMRSPAEVTSNVSRLESHVPSDLWVDLQERGLLDPAVPLPGQVVA